GVGAGVTAGALLPFTPVAPWIGLVPLPPLFFVFVVGMVLVYLAVVEIVKHGFYRRLGTQCGVRAPPVRAQQEWRRPSAGRPEPAGRLGTSRTRAQFSPVFEPSGGTRGVPVPYRGGGAAAPRYGPR